MLATLRGALLGSFYTLVPHFQRALFPLEPLATERFVVTQRDHAVGDVRVSALVSRARAPARRCVVLLHGLGGDEASGYLLPMAHAARDAGLDSVRPSLRGADGSGEDLYHAGLTDDLRAILASKELEPYEAVHLVGFSLGGHVALKYATEEHDPRLRSVAAIGSPLDLEAAAHAFDRRRRSLYRRHVVSSLHAAHDALVRRGRARVSRDEARSITSIVAWDGRIVAPRFGYASASAYYQAESVAPRLSRLELPSLYLGAEHDPMVPSWAVKPSLERASAALSVQFFDAAGHIGFSTGAHIEGARGGDLEAQVIDWLLRRG